MLFQFRNITFEKTKIHAFNKLKIALKLEFIQKK